MEIYIDTDSCPDGKVCSKNLPVLVESWNGSQQKHCEVFGMGICIDIAFCPG
jgi:hypothetical protein